MKKYLSKTQKRWIIKRIFGDLWKVLKTCIVWPILRPFSVYFKGIFRDLSKPSQLWFFKQYLETPQRHVDLSKASKRGFFGYLPEAPSSGFLKNFRRPLNSLKTWMFWLPPHSPSIGFFLKNFKIPLKGVKDPTKHGSKSRFKCLTMWFF